MIYIKNNTEIQTIFIPRNELQKEAYIASTKTYEDGYRDGLEDGKEQQKDKLLNLYVTENGQYEREDGWGVVTVDVHTEGGSCNLGEGEFVYGTSDVGRYELNASDDGYDGWSKIYLEIEGEAIKVFRASELLDSFNNDNGAGLDYGGNYYVGGEITEIREINTQYGNATYFLDNGFQVFRGKWIDGSGFSSEDQIKVGAYIVVYGVLADYKGTLQFSKNSQVIAYQECTGGEIISCNLEDKSVTPSMSDRDGNNLIVVEEDEGYDGLSRVVINPQTLYNEGVEAGKTEKETDIAENARVLNVTKNGVYQSKYSDPIMPTTVTGVYADGTEFYNYAYLEGISYDSGFIVSEDMKVEIWWKGDVSKTDKNLFGSQVNNLNAIFKIRIPDTAYRFDGEIAMRQVTYRNAESDRWYHFKMSYADGFWVDGVKIGDFSANISGTPDKLYINSNTPYSFNGVNGYFGMIKITTNGVENIIIPTAEGLKNITTDEMLQVVQDGSYTYTKNLPTYGEGEIYKTINVNVPSVQEQITDYYYCPITITDSGFGERAKSFMVKNESMYGENGWINDDSFVYLPTANNMNEVRTKTSPSLVASFPFDDNAAYYTGALYMNVEEVQMNNVVLSNLYKLELGSGCHILRMESSNLPNINTLIIRYNGQQLFDYHFGLTQFKNGGKLYVYEGLGNAENLRAALGSEWTIEYL